MIKADKNTCNNRTSGHVKKVNMHLNLAGLSFEGLVEAQKTDNRGVSPNKRIKYLENPLAISVLDVIAYRIRKTSELINVRAASRKQINK